MSTASNIIVGGPGPVLLPLDTWATEHLTDLIQAQSQKDFDNAFDAFAAPDVKVVFNGASQSRAQYKKHLEDERAGSKSATINISNTVVAPVLGSQESTTSGIVGITFTATFVNKDQGIGKPGSHVEHSTLNVEVAEVGRKKGEIGDFRRVISLNQVFVDQPGPTPRSSA